jgi:hypothetical protein
MTMDRYGPLSNPTANQDRRTIRLESRRRKQPASRVKFLKLRVQLGLYPFIRIASESEAEGRFVRLDRLDDGFCGKDRIARLFRVLVAVFLATQAGSAGVVGDRLSGLVQGPAGKIRAEAARFDDH